MGVQRTKTINVNGEQLRLTSRWVQRGSGFRIRIRIGDWEYFNTGHVGGADYNGMSAEEIREAHRDVAEQRAVNKFLMSRFEKACGKPAIPERDYHEILQSIPDPEIIEYAVENLGLINPDDSTEEEGA